MTQEGDKRFFGVRVLIFDLDGTLVDSRLDLALAVNEARRRMGLPPLEHEVIFGYVGHGAPMLIRRSLGPNAGEQDVQRALAFFREHYGKHLLDHTIAYPGVQQALVELAARGYSGSAQRAAGPEHRRGMAVLTNKPEDFSCRILEGLGLSGYFRQVYGGESFEKKKPDPVGVMAVLRELSATPQEAMVIGDSEIDVQTARNAGAWACGVTYGLGRQGLAEHPPDLLLDNLADLLPHLA